VDTVIKFKHCTMFADLAQSEMVLGATPHARHHCLLQSYVQNLWRGPETVREIIVGDIRAALDLGASRRAADLLIVLRLFLSDHPEARIARDQRCLEILSDYRRKKRAESGNVTGKGVVGQYPSTARHELNRHRDQFSRVRPTSSLLPERSKQRRPDRS
jgi:hypothetical protein